MALKALSIEVRDPTTLSGSEIDELYGLFRTAFQADRRGFELDLLEKHKVLTVRTEEGLSAFTSLRLYTPEAEVRVFYSGDTFAGPQARIGHKLPSLWARYVFKEIGPKQATRDFWLLLCSGFRTYRILPVCFQRYVPGPGGPDSLLRQRDRWASALFGQSFQNGVVIPPRATPLYQPEPPKRLKNDSAVRRFAELNPGYSQGHELVCLVSLDPQNLTPAGRRLVEGGAPPS